MITSKTRSRMRYEDMLQKAKKIISIGNVGAVDRCTYESFFKKVMSMLTQEDKENLRKLEESLWIETTRFSHEHMDSVLAPDFFEFGRSGKTYNREDTLSVPKQAIHAKIPLKNFEEHAISDDVVLVTYISEVEADGSDAVGNRSSLWVKTQAGWQLKFHQGTAINADDSGTVK